MHSYNSLQCLSQCVSPTPLHHRSGADQQGHSPVRHPQGQNQTTTGQQAGHGLLTEKGQRPGQGKRAITGRAKTKCQEGPEGSQGVLQVGHSHLHRQVRLHYCHQKEQDQLDTERPCRCPRQHEHGTTLQPSPESRTPKHGPITSGSRHQILCPGHFK